MSNPITRKLAREDCDRQPHVIDQDQIAAIPEPIVILGDPGLGKSVLTKTLGELPSMKYCLAGTFVRTAGPETLISADERIIVDGLDEIASSTPGGAVDSVLSQLSEMGNPPFILSCREADWRGAADRIKIVDDYGAVPVLLRLQPFGYGDAEAFLSNEFPTVNPAFVLAHLANRGLEGIYKNPLTLRMLGEVAEEDGSLPDTRTQLFDRACHVMLSEENPRHLDDSHVHRSHEDLLLAAGAICATQVLSARIGVYTGPYANTPEDFVNVSDVAELLFGEAADDALRTRLFQAEGESRFTHIHRVIAEYLGAKWLVRCFDKGVSERRIFALFRQGAGVPTSLRGLHAWMAHFSDVLAGRCIGADPYAVLRYGEVETLGLEQARALLAALEKLSEEDPYFRSEDWGRHPASGLMRPELKCEIRAIIGTPGLHRQLTVLLLEAMKGTDLAKELAPALGTILFDRNRVFAERSGAANATFTTSAGADWQVTIHRLLEMDDAHSARLACEILDRVGALTVSTGTAIDVVLAFFGLASNQDPASVSGEMRHVPDHLFGDLDPGQLATLLDGLAERARPLIAGADHSATSYLADLIRCLTVQILEADPGIDAESVWAWIDWLDGNRGYNDNTRKRLTEIFCKEHALRAALLEHVLLTPCEGGAWMAARYLAKTKLNLYPTPEDLVGVLKALRARAGDGSIDADTWRHILRLDRSPDGISEIVSDAAIRIADDDPELLAALAEVAEVVKPEWKIEQERQHAREETRRQEVFQAHRSRHSQRAHEVTAGNVQDLAAPANVYLGWCSEFDGSETPEARVRGFLGDILGDQALMGFIAVLDRSDLPSAADIARIHGEDEHWKAEGPMICGIAEMLRQGRPIDAIDRPKLAAIYMAWHRALELNAAGQIDIGYALETVLFTNEADWEDHFRASIEPQLAHDMSHINELHRLATDPRFARLAGRLAVDWLRDYPALSAPTQTQLLTCALENVTHEMFRALRADIGANPLWDHEKRLLWLSADYVIDFDDRREELDKAAADNPDFLWFIRDRVGTGGGERFADFSLNHLVFVVEGFGAHWPWTERPGGVTTGDCNPWDASEFIRRTIYAVATRPSPDATDALQNLIADHAPSYTDTAKHALTLQRRARRDFEYAAPTVGQLRAVMAKQLPETIDDMRAYFADRIEILQERMQASNTDMWEAYWTEDGPRGENFCRNRLIEYISGQLPQSIRFEPEMHMPGQMRADIAAIRNALGLPVEIKGQWHRDLWDAASDQLDANYVRDWHAEGRGVYVVLWFGDVRGKQVPGHPEGLERPETPEGLRKMLIDRLPEARRSWIDVFVIDVSRP